MAAFTITVVVTVTLASRPSPRHYPELTTSEAIALATSPITNQSMRGLYHRGYKTGTHGDSDAYLGLLEAESILYNFGSREASLGRHVLKCSKQSLFLVGLPLLKKTMSNRRDVSCPRRGHTCEDCADIPGSCQPVESFQLKGASFMLMLDDLGWLSVVDHHTKRRDGDVKVLFNAVRGSRCGLPVFGTVVGSVWSLTPPGTFSQWVLQVAMKTALWDGSKLGNKRPLVRNASSGWKKMKRLSLWTILCVTSLNIPNYGAPSCR
ncbi:hypothetical protein V8F20_007486 [Naviculisporaceae sp. PSN 640]